MTGARDEVNAAHGTCAVRALVLATIVAMAIAGCGASSGESAATYVKSICTTLGQWKNAIQSAGSRLQTSGAATASPANAKRDYLNFVSALDNTTGTAAQALKSAGSPSVPGGGRIATRLQNAFARAASGLSAAHTHALSIPTTSVAAFEAAASGVTAQIRSSLEGIATITPGQSASLRSAANADPTCRALKG